MPGVSAAILSASAFASTLGDNLNGWRWTCEGRKQKKKSFPNEIISALHATPLLRLTCLLTLQEFETSQPAIPPVCLFFAVAVIPSFHEKKRERHRNTERERIPKRQSGMLRTLNISALSLTSGLLITTLRSNRPARFSAASRRSSLFVPVGNIKGTKEYHGLPHFLLLTLKEKNQRKTRSCARQVLARATKGKWCSVQPQHCTGHAYKLHSRRLSMLV